MTTGKPSLVPWLSVFFYLTRAKESLVHTAMQLKSHLKYSGGSASTSVLFCPREVRFCTIIIQEMSSSTISGVASHPFEDPLCAGFARDDPYRGTERGH